MESAPPSEATDAVLVASDPVEADARPVQGIDWAALPVETRSVLSSFVAHLSGQGFQSSAIGDAVRIINDMVGTRCLSPPPGDFNLTGDL